MRSSTWNKSPRFDCELPPKVRAELLPRERPRGGRRPKHPWFSIAVAFAIPAALVVAVSLSDIRHHDKATTSAPIRQNAGPAPAPVLTPPRAQLQPAPLLVTSPNDERFFAPEVRRALPVGLEARMPYGESVRIRILGTMPNQESLPLTGNHIGDTYHVGAAEFVWVAPDGSTGQWIDP